MENLIVNNLELMSISALLNISLLWLLGHQNNKQSRIYIGKECKTAWSNKSLLPRAVLQKELCQCKYRFIYCFVAQGVKVRKGLWELKYSRAPNCLAMPFSIKVSLTVFLSYTGNSNTIIASSCLCNLGQFHTQRIISKCVWSPKVAKASTVMSQSKPV